MTEEKYEVGDTITDGAGEEWVVGKKWVHEKWTDIELFNKESGERGSLRVDNI